jgi:hypothetical protein
MLTKGVSVRCGGFELAPWSAPIWSKYENCRRERKLSLAA